MENSLIKSEEFLKAIEIIVNARSAEKIAELQDQIEKLQNPASVLRDMEMDAIDNSELFEALSDFNMIHREKLSSTLEAVFSSYIRNGIGGTDDAFDVYANLNRFISKMYLYDGLITRNLNKSAQFRNDIETACYFTQATISRG